MSSYMNDHIYDHMLVHMGVHIWNHIWDHRYLPEGFTVLFVTILHLDYPMHPVTAILRLCQMPLPDYVIMVRVCWSLQ